MWRHGTVMIDRVAELPDEAQQHPSMFLTHSEIKDHEHQVMDRTSAELWEYQGTLYLQVIADNASIIHEPQTPIMTLPRGIYRVWTD